MLERSELTIVEGVPFSEIAFIDDAIFEYNVTFVKDRELKWIRVLCTDDEGTEVGGLEGFSLWGWFTLTAIWVSERHRRKGLGSAILSRAESEAISCGCHSAGVALFAVENPEFFTSSMFRVEASLPDFPPGYSRLFLTKPLNAREVPFPAGYSLSMVDSRKTIEFAIEAIGAQSDRVVGVSPKQQVNIALKDNDGKVLGGLFGHCQHGWLFVDVLFLDESVRRMGFGRQLMSRAEAKAKEMGVRHAYLDTFEWQAREFYEKQGYEVFVVYKYFPGGQNNYGLRKNLL